MPDGDLRIVQEKSVACIYAFGDELTDEEKSTILKVCQIRSDSNYAFANEHSTGAIQILKLLLPISALNKRYSMLRLLWKHEKQLNIRENHLKELAAAFCDCPKSQPERICAWRDFIKTRMNDQTLRISMLEKLIREIDEEDKEAKMATKMPILSDDDFFKSWEELERVKTLLDNELVAREILLGARRVVKKRRRSFHGGQQLSPKRASLARRGSLI